MTNLFVKISKILIIVFLFTSYSVFAQYDEKLMVAAANGETDKVLAMIKKGANVNARNSTRWSSLAYAAKFNHLEVAKILIENGADINQKVNTGATALQIALNSENFDIADYLVAQKADVNVKDILGMTALAWAAKDGNLKVVKYLVSKGANVNSQNTNGRTIVDITNSPEVKVYLKSVGGKTGEELFSDNTN
ncbi:MAG: hypothetical protein A2046_10080 [Bacteroidetes bacterium GWA2_30_7]|nr:MAG: hypothetical protein A2046_10080 [Bacteroidetes bacterium GWA2_30_7]